MRVLLTKTLVALCSTGLVLQLTACGTILHPERKGQKSGQIDPAIALFDAVGLLFFLIPGVIAFAVDFSNGTIYLPGGRQSNLTDDELQQIAPGGTLDSSAVAELLRARGIIDNNVQTRHLQIQSLDSMAEVYAKLALHDARYTQASR